MVIEADLHTIDAPFLVFRLNTIYINVHAKQIECHEITSYCGKHALSVANAYWYMHFGLRLSSSYWTHAYHVTSKLISLDTCISCWIQAVHIDCMCGVLQVKKTELCALGGVGGGDRGGPAYN